MGCTPLSPCVVLHKLLPVSMPVFLSGKERVLRLQEAMLSKGRICERSLDLFTGNKSGWHWVWALSPRVCRRQVQGPLNFEGEDRKARPGPSLLHH